jgi:hypothetical protein
MKKSQILKKLGEFLDPIEIGFLQIITNGNPGGIEICFAICRILNVVPSHHEKEVSGLLKQLLKIHFK